jgi:hypothetical protein
MTSLSVPSTLVKCLYLFFDLPAVGEAGAAEAIGDQFSGKERRILLQKMFIQVRFRRKKENFLSKLFGGSAAIPFTIFLLEKE